MKVKEIIKLLEANGWQHVRTRGDHRIFCHLVTGKTTVVSGKLSSDLTKGMESAIFRQTGLKKK